MKCPICKAANERSTVTPGAGCSTMMYCPPFYDEDGRYHNHDRNVTTVSCMCSKGHRFEGAVYNTCWCGWTNDPKSPRSRE